MEATAVSWDLFGDRAGGASAAQGLVNRERNFVATDAVEVGCCEAEGRWRWDVAMALAVPRSRFGNRRGEP